MRRAESAVCLVATPAPRGWRRGAAAALWLAVLGLSPAPAWALDDAAEAAPAAPTPTPEPFGWGDFTWLNGATRQTTRLLETTWFTGQVDIDLNYNFSFHRPIDDTVVGSTSLARHNEIQLSFLGAGGDLHWRQVRGRLFLQHGTRTQTVPRNDASPGRGQFALADVYRYVSEAYAGIHLDVLHGMNIDVGLFNSYIGLFSYDNFENWAYQPSFTSDNTPWFFSGLRVQMFPSDRLKTELWLVNGWQSYGKFNTWPALGAQVAWRPTTHIAGVQNTYIGTDTLGAPDRIRLHSDTSVMWRYLFRPQRAISQAALSATFDIGGEVGDGVGLTAKGARQAQNFISGMLYHRAWLAGGSFAWTVGGGFVHNPGRYLALAPPGIAALAFPIAPGQPFDAWDLSTSLDWMPTPQSTWRIELVHRQSAQNYFAGRGGVTSPTGLLADAPTRLADAQMGWSPDLVRAETRLVVAFMLRF